ARATPRAWRDEWCRRENRAESRRAFRAPARRRPPAPAGRRASCPPVRRRRCSTLRKFVPPWRFEDEPPIERTAADCLPPPEGDVRRHARLSRTTIVLFRSDVKEGDANRFNRRGAPWAVTRCSLSVIRYSRSGTGNGQRATDNGHAAGREGAAST